MNGPTHIFFLATLPPIQSAIKVGQDEARLQLALPASERDAVKASLDCHGKVLRVMVEVVEDGSET